MKKFYLLTKTLLVAALLMIGANAWAAAETVYERGTTNAWADADLSDWSQSYCTAAISGGLSVSTTNGGWTCTKGISVTENAVVTLNVTLKTGGASGRSGSYDYVSIGGVIYTKDLHTLVRFPEGLNTRNYEIPEGTVDAATDALYKLHYVEAITIPSTMTNIKYGSFDTCENTGIVPTTNKAKPKR